jgi:hypothetical protein
MTTAEAVEYLRRKAGAGNGCFSAIEAKYNTIANLLEAKDAECKAWREHRRLHDERAMFAPGAQYSSPDEYNAYKEPRERAWAVLCEARRRCDELEGK